MKIDTEFQDRRQKDLIVAEIVKYMQAAEKICGDRRYPAFLAFSTLGSGLYRDLGPKEFMSVVGNIIEKETKD